MGETGRALEKISGQVTEISTHVGAIVEGAREQAIGLKEINTAVNMMDQGTQQNAAMVEEQTAAGESLATEAAALFTLVGQFKLDSQSSARPAARMSETPASVGNPRELRRRLAGSFNGNAAIKQEGWEDF